MILIVSNFRSRKEGKERGQLKEEYGGISGEVEGDADYGGMVQTSQQHVEWDFGTRGLRMLAAFWAGITVKVTQETVVVPRCKRIAIGTPF